MEEGSFLFIEEQGRGPHGPITKSLIKMHVMDRVVSDKSKKRAEDESNNTQPKAIARSEHRKTR